MKLMKELPKISALILKNTRGAHPDLKSRLELLEVAYGAAAVANDFRDWATERSVAGDIPRYPISEYMKVVDSRLGSAPMETPLDTANPQIADVTALSYDLTGFLPPVKAVAELLALYTLDEIKGALVEYAEGLTERELKTAIRSFFANGGSGASAVILVRRKRTQK